MQAALLPRSPMQVLTCTGQRMPLPFGCSAQPAAGLAMGAGLLHAGQAALGLQVPHAWRRAEDQRAPASALGGAHAQQSLPICPLATVPPSKQLHLFRLWQVPGLRVACRPDQAGLRCSCSVLSHLVHAQVPLDATQAATQFPSGRAVVALAAQVYTERMGHIQLSCEGGCACDTVEYNLLHPFYRWAARLLGVACWAGRQCAVWQCLRASDLQLRPLSYQQGSQAAGCWQWPLLAMAY